VKYRLLPASGLQVSEIGFNFGNTKEWAVHEDDAIRFLYRALDLGITLFDTSEREGKGYGEELLAKALLKQRNEIVISTKVGYDISSTPSFLRPKPKTEQDFTPIAIRHSVDEALKRLRTDRIDVLQLHHISQHEVESDEVWDTLGNLKTAGKVLSFGVVLKGGRGTLRPGLDCLQYREPAVIQHHYEIIAPYPGRILHASAALKKGGRDREALAGYEHGKQAKVAMATRFFIRDPITQLTGNFNGKSESEVLRYRERVAELGFLIGPATGRTLSQAGLLWLLAENSTASCLPRLRNLDELREFADASNRTPLLPEELDRVRELQDYWLSDPEKELEELA
jgi:aryl-alcohol dehydrogenase-like predicted oxidoreductase